MITIVRIWENSIPIHEKAFRNPVDAHPHAAWCMSKLLEQGFIPLKNEVPMEAIFFKSFMTAPCYVRVQILEVN